MSKLKHILQEFWYILVPVILVMLALFSAQIFCLDQTNNCCFNQKQIYQFYGIIITVIGSVALLFCVINAFKAIKNTSLIANEINTLNNIIKPSGKITLQAIPADLGLKPTLAELKLTPPIPESDKDKFIYLFNEIEKLKIMFLDTKKELINKIDCSNSSLNTKIDKVITDEIYPLTKVLESIAIGDYKKQLFASICMIAGAILLGIA